MDIIKVIPWHYYKIKIQQLNNVERLNVNLCGLGVKHSELIAAMRDEKVPEFIRISK